MNRLSNRWFSHHFIPSSGNFTEWSVVLSHSVYHFLFFFFFFFFFVSGNWAWSERGHGGGCKEYGPHHRTESCALEEGGLHYWVLLATLSLSLSLSLSPSLSDPYLPPSHFPISFLSRFLTSSRKRSACTRFVSLARCPPTPSKSTRTWTPRRYVLHLFRVCLLCQSVHQEGMYCICSESVCFVRVCFLQWGPCAYVIVHTFCYPVRSFCR